MSPPSPLSPVPEAVTEDGSRRSDRSADVPEETSRDDLKEKEKKEVEPDKRDSKIDDGFADTLPNLPDASQEQDDSKNQSDSVPTVNVNLRSDSPQPQLPSSPDRQSQRTDGKNEEPETPSTTVLALLVLGVTLAALLVSLDRTIITTAIPAITNEFHSISEVGWYGSSYLITGCALQPTYGRIYTLFDVKWTFLHSVVAFQLGSLICGVAPNSTTLIIGRAIAGWGSAGITTGSFTVIAHAVSLQRRPLYMAAIGAMYGIGAAGGPLLGGVFTDLVTWRWCFYINLPVGAVTLFVILFLFKPAKVAGSKGSYLSRLREVDSLGTTLILGSFTMLFLALQYSNEGYAWSDRLIIGLLCGFGVTLLLFIAWQGHQKERALIVPTIFLKRTVMAACFSGFFIYAVVVVHGYYLPLWFQAIKGVSIARSGVDLLPYIIPNVVFCLISGILVSKIGYFTPPAIIGCAIAAAGSGLISTLETTTGTVQWAAYLCIAGSGLGIAVQQSYTAVQAVLALEQVPIATAAVTCFQSLGGAAFISAGNCILSNYLRQSSNDLPGASIEAAISAGATEFREMIPSEMLPSVLRVYNEALQKVFISAIPLSGLAFICSLFLEWKSVRRPENSLGALEQSAVPVAVPPTDDVEARASSMGRASIEKQGQEEKQ